MKDGFLYILKSKIKKNTQKGSVHVKLQVKYRPNNMSMGPMRSNMPTVQQMIQKPQMNQSMPPQKSQNVPMQMSQPPINVPNMYPNLSNNPQQPPMGQPIMGQPPIGQPPMGQPPMNQPPMGQPSMGQPPTGQTNLQINHLWVNLQINHLLVNLQWDNPHLVNLQINHLWDSLLLVSLKINHQ